MGFSYGHEGYDFYTCGEYSLCQNCSRTKKACINHSEEMLIDYLRRQIIKRQQEEKEYKSSLNESIDYPD